MKLGLAIGYSGAEMRLPLELIKSAEDLGFDSLWTAEAYGSDATSPLAYLAAITDRIRLGTSVMQLAGRPPAMAAMQAATIDALAGGDRFIAGIGVSGPQIVEGWYGQPWGSPYWRIRDYVEIMRKVLAREEPVTHDGREISLPYEGEGAMGIGKPLKSILHMNPDIPIWLGTGGEANVALTAEIADGWFPLNFVPGMMDTYRPWLDKGFARAGGGKSLADLEVQPMVSVAVTDDIEGTLARMKPGVALYVGGMGHREKNFHNDMMVKRGYPEAAAEIQELYLAGRKDEAIAAVPDDYCDEGALIGPPARIRERFAQWERSGATGLTLQCRQPEALELMAEISGSLDKVREST
ncbi:MAG: LLM class F420-dependent oxidoreductase [Actinomycetia bacterium]|nr:LLM class F420-dependent oxidoreductase [Actinomycetes bacterium]